ncbi:MAG: radical SAM protein [Candidatus Hodarchaeota archaeon]
MSETSSSKFSSQEDDYMYQGIDWELFPTYDCNLRCKHCYLSCSPETEDKEKVLSIEEWKAYLTQLDTRGSLIEVNGGEITLVWEKTKSILDCLARKGDCLFTLITNGTLITPEMIPFFASLTPSLMGIRVSLAGGSKETNDFIRGKGSFEKTLKGLKLLCPLTSTHDIKIVVPFQVHQKTTFEDIEKLIELGSELGFSIATNTLFLDGRTMRNWQKIMLHPKKARELMVYAEKLQLKYFSRNAPKLMEEQTISDKKAGAYLGVGEPRLCGVHTGRFKSLKPNGDLGLCSYFALKRSFNKKKL